MSAEPALAYASAVPDPPQPVSQGTYALYHTPQGGLHLVYRPFGEDIDQHLEVPPFIVGMARKAAGGGDLGPLGTLLMPKGT